jgi:hypothetical protein
MPLMEGSRRHSGSILVFISNEKFSSSFLDTSVAERLTVVRIGLAV